MRINIKPLSVNEAWKGHRYKTDKYNSYLMTVYILLPSLDVPKKEKLKLSVEFGLSSKGADIDNPLKPFVDILQKRYNFNDNRIYELNVKKEIVPKGKEYIDFEIGIIK